MNERVPFLCAILDQPTNDAPRLVYADWLDERGDPHGELLRLQCRAFRLPADDPERDDLTRQAQTLLTRYEFAWRGNLRSLGAHEEPTRGFVPPLSLQLDQFLYGHWFFSPLPLRVVLELSPAAGSISSELDLLLDSPRLARLTDLRIHAPFDPFAEPDVRAPAQPVLMADLIAQGERAVHTALALLAAARRFLLRHLDLSETCLGNGLLAALLASPAVAGLDRLTLRATGLGDAELCDLAACPHLLRLVHLDLAGNSIRDLTPLLRADHFPSLRRVHLHENEAVPPEQLRLLSQKLAGR